MPARTPKTLAQSAHTLADLKRFAKGSPEQATEFLTAVEKQLRKSGAGKAADSVKKVLTDKTGALVERIAEHEKRLTGVFPARASDWAKVQVKVKNVGYDVKPSPVPVQFIEGKVKREGSQLSITTIDGRELKLTRAQAGGVSLPPGWMAGLIDDGPMVLSGLISEDSKSFEVEGFALNADGKYREFTFGRVSQDEPTTITTRRGKVKLESPELRQKLMAVPGLGIILPGAPTRRGAGLVYKGNPDEFFGLARFRATTTTGDATTRTVGADMALSHFSNKPVELPAAYQDRVSHTSRVWLRGNLELAANGAASSFTASYVGKLTDDLTLSDVSTREADVVQAVVMTTDTGERP
jgi:hypothetical protein